VKNTAIACMTYVTTDAANVPAAAAVRHLQSDVVASSALSAVHKKTSFKFI